MKTTISKVYKCKACGWNKKLNYKAGDTLVRYCPTCSSSDLIMSDSSENHLINRRSEMKHYKCKDCGSQNVEVEENLASLRKESLIADILKAKAELSSKEGGENFGQREVRDLKDRYNYHLLLLGDPSERQMADALKEFEQWCSNYTGKKESKVEKNLGERIVGYHCWDCGRDWKGEKNSDILCPKCNSDKVEIIESKVSEGLVTYKCKDCDKTTAIEGEEGKVVKVCPHCGSENLEKVSMDTGESKMAEGMAAYKCYSCGLLFTLSDAPSVCPYCGGKPVMRWTTESLNNQIDKLSI